MKKIVLSFAGTSTFFCSVAVFAQKAVEKVAQAKEVADESALKGVGNETMLELLIKGGWVMIPLAVCSLVALTLLLERLIVLRKNNIVPKSFYPGLKEMITGSPNLDRAFEYCVKNEAPIGNILKVGIEKWRKKRSIEDVEKAVEDAAGNEVGKLERSLRGFKIIAAIAPLLGLFGTVLGMIHAFQTVALSSEAIGKAAKLAAGIYEAMVTTAFGLFIAIPALLMYYMFAWFVEGITDDIEIVCGEFMDDYQDATERNE